MLSSQSDWCIVDGQFDNRLFFDNIVAALELRDDLNEQSHTWVTETLDWWDK
jgi:hypothetical protein